MNAAKARSGLNIWWMRLPSAMKMLLAVGMMAGTLTALGGRISVQAGLPALTSAHADSIRAHSRRMDLIERRLSQQNDSVMAYIRDIKAEQRRTNCYLEALASGRTGPAPRCLQ